MDQAVPPQHMNDLKYLLDGHPSECGNHSMCVRSLGHGPMVSFVSLL